MEKETARRLIDYLVVCDLQIESPKETELIEQSIKELKRNMTVDKPVIEIRPMEFLNLARNGKAEASILVGCDGGTTSWKTAKITISDR